MLYWLIPLLILFVLAGAGFYFSRVLTQPANQTYEDAQQSAIEDGVLAEGEWEGMAKQAISMPSPYGYRLRGYYLANEGSEKTVIVCHGITSNLINSIKYARVFLDLGFNALIYDHRNHGKSGGENTTFGYYEADDLRTVIDWLIENKPESRSVGVHGESMGAVIALLAAAKDDRITFVVADCGYASLKDQVIDRARADYHLPSFPLVPVMMLWARALTGMQFNQIVPEEAITRIDAPVLIIHGEQDAYIQPSHAHRLAQADPQSPRPCWMAPNADHAESLVKNPQAYQQEIARFLEQGHI